MLCADPGTGAQRMEESGERREKREAQKRGLKVKAAARVESRKQEWSDYSNKFKEQPFE